MRRAALLLLVGAGVGVILGSVAFTSYTLAGRAANADDVDLSPEACRETGEYAVLAASADEHLQNLKMVRNKYARILGEPEVE